MDGVPDVYADQLGLNLGPLGASLFFSASVAGPVAQGVPQQTREVAVIRVSLEHLKLIAYVLRHQVRKYESQFGVQIPIPLEVLNQMHIGREDWNECWGDGR